MHPDSAIAPPGVPAPPTGIIAFSLQGRSPSRIGEIAVRMGFATREVVDGAVAQALAAHRPTGAVLVDLEALTPDQLARVVAVRFGVDYVDLTEFAVDLSAAALVPAALARRYEAVPIGYRDERTLLIAVNDPSNLLALDDIKMLTEFEIVEPVVAARDDLGALIAKVGRLDDVGGESDDEPDDELTVSDVRDAGDDAPVIKLVHAIIGEAIELGASDIHFDPDGGEMRVQFRIDGVLTSSSSVPRRMVRGVVSRVKIMSNLDISERRLPQDGRLAVAIDGRTVDVRVVTLPLVAGESVVMRVLDHGGGLIELDRLGLDDAELGRLTHALAQPYGAILATGPTGSGKTTTLYGALGVLNDGARSIITIEDPVEYRMDGVKQIQVNAKVGMTFARGLRSIVRADPDVIMVGEIRDHETAQIAVEAALTGHLVLSTLHTRDAPTAITRLVDMGIEPFLTASAIDCVVAQRLARTLCSNCKTERLVPADVLLAAGYAMAVADDLPAYDAVGCNRCGGTGYRGRIGLYEVMPVSEDIRSLVMRRESADAIAEAAIAAGMMRLRDDGLEKVRAGVTSVAEVSRVAGS